MYRERWWMRSDVMLILPIRTNRRHAWLLTMTSAKFWDRELLALSTKCASTQDRHFLLWRRLATLTMRSTSLTECQRLSVCLLKMWQEHFCTEFITGIPCVDQICYVRLSSGPDACRRRLVWLGKCCAGSRLTSMAGRSTSVVEWWGLQSLHSCAASRRAQYSGRSSSSSIRLIWSLS